MFFILSKVLSFLIDPLLWIFACLLIGLYFRNNKKGNRFLKLGIFLLFFFSNKWICNQAFLFWEERTIEVTQIQEPFDVAIVLGGYSESRFERPNDGQLFHFASQAANRLTQTVELYKTGKVKKIMLSGGSSNIVGEKISESLEVEKYLLRIGIPSNDIILEPNARNTFENALLSKNVLFEKELNHQKILMVTSAFHMFRSKKCFEKVGLEVTPFSVDFMGKRKSFLLNDLLPEGGNISMWKMLIREWVGLIAYKLTDKI